MIIVHAESDDIMGSFNCSTALSNCSLMAHSMGLGSCYLGFVHTGANEDKKIKRWLKIPRGNRCHGAMVIGHPDIRYHRLVERRSPDIEWL